MRKRVLAGGIFGAALLAAVCGGAAGAADPPAAGPPRGLAIINCKLDGDRSLSDCKLMRETPPGLGLGAMALQMSHVLRAPPAVASDASGRVTLPLMFQPGGADTAPAGPAAGTGDEPVVGQPPPIEVPGAAQA